MLLSCWRRTLRIIIYLSLRAVDRPLSLLKDCGPAAVSVEITCLTSLGGGATSPGGGASLLPAFIQMIDSMLASGRDFDLAQGYLALFLKVSQSERSIQFM